MIEIGKILRSFWDKNRDAETKTQLFQTEFTQKDDAQTVEEMHIPGVQYVPPVDSRNFVSRISAAFKIAIGIDDNVPKLETLAIGDRIAYASNSGAIVCSIWYKNDGTIAIATDKDLTADVDGDLTATVAGATTIDSTGNITSTAPKWIHNGDFELNGDQVSDGTLDVTGNISSDADVIADALATVISLINHFHLGNLGVNTAPSLPAGGGTPGPASPASTNASGDIIDGSSTNLSTHHHTQGADSPSGDTQQNTSGPI